MSINRVQFGNCTSWELNLSFDNLSFFTLIFKFLKFFHQFITIFFFNFIKIKNNSFGFTSFNFLINSIDFSSEFFEVNGLFFFSWEDWFNENGIWFTALDNLFLLSGNGADGQ